MLAQFVVHGTYAEIEKVDRREPFTSAPVAIEAATRLYKSNACLHVWVRYHPDDGAPPVTIWRNGRAV